MGQTLNPDWWKIKDRRLAKFDHDRATYPMRHRTLIDIESDLDTVLQSK